MANGNMERESFGSRLGGLLMAAGCAIGLGNIWRFPYITGKFGGGWFVLFYLGFLLLLAAPVLMVELAIGRAGQRTMPGALRKLQRPGSRIPWSSGGHIQLAGNMVLLMFYTVVTGWLLCYFRYYISGVMTPMTGGYGEFFQAMLAEPLEQFSCLYATIILVLAACVGGLRCSVEKVVKITMIGLFLLLLVLLVHSLRLPGASAGVKEFFRPNLTNLKSAGLWETMYQAMAQAFFTLSIGIGSIAVCGSYMKKDASIATEGLLIVFLDTLVAIIAGIMIFAVCSSCGVKADGGPGLVFIALPHVFQNLSHGVLWGALFFLFMFLAAYSTLVAVFENLVSYGIDEFSWSRRKSVVVFGVLLALLSIPCVLGFNLWSGFQPLGAGTSVLDLEDFIVSSNLLPLGAVFILIFCFHRQGWGGKNLLTELNTGKGLKFPRALLTFMCLFLPAAILILWGVGIYRTLKPLFH